MTNYREILVSLAWRSGAAAALGGLGYWLMATARGGFAAVPALLFGCAALVAGALLAAVPLARLLAEPCGNLFYPSARFRGPQPMYGIPEARRCEGRYQEALDGFRAIARDYPHEVRAYTAMIDLAIMDLKDAALAEQIYREGLAALPRAAERDTLARMYAAIRTRLEDHALPQPQPVRLPDRPRRPHDRPSRPRGGPWPGGWRW